MNDSAKLLIASKAGEIDRILELAGFDDERDASDGIAADVTAYKWLLVAEDFGHDVEDVLEAMHTGSAIHYDDSQAVEGSIHFELGVAYLRGEDGLRVDQNLAKEHLETARGLEVHVTTDLAKTFAGIRRDLDAEGLATFDAVWAKSAPKRTAPKKKKAAAPKKKKAAAPKKKKAAAPKKKKKAAAPKKKKKAAAPPSRRTTGAKR